jgi:hypothetical protein
MTLCGLIDQYSNDALNASSFKYMPQGTLMQRTVIDVEPQTISTFWTIAIIPFGVGFLLADARINSTDLNPGSSLEFGMGLTDNNCNVLGNFISQATIPADGGSTTWFTDPSRSGFSIGPTEVEGFLAISLQSADITKAGTLTFVTQFGYDN